MNLAFTTDEIEYGPEPLQLGTLLVPVSAKPRPVAILIHGGYWRQGFTREAMTDLARDLGRVGYAVWNIDYRRVGDPGGGYPGTARDVAAAVDKLAELAPNNNLDLSRVVVLGHSAGGQLGLWSAARGRLPATAVGAKPQVQIRGAVSLAGVLDLAAAARASGAGSEAELSRSVLGYLGGPPGAVPDRYSQQSPIARVPIGLPQLLLHGGNDERVSIDQSRAYLQAATAAGDQVKLIELPNVSHFDLVKSTAAWWDDVLIWLASVIGDPLL